MINIELCTERNMFCQIEIICRIRVSKINYGNKSIRTLIVTWNTTLESVHISRENQLTMKYSTYTAEDIVTFLKTCFIVFSLTATFIIEWFCLNILFFFCVLSEIILYGSIRKTFKEPFSEVNINKILNRGLDTRRVPLTREQMGCECVMRILRRTHQVN